MTNRRTLSPFNATKNLLGTFHNDIVDTGQFRHFDTVAVIGRSADDATQESHVITTLFHGDVVVLDTVNLFFDGSEFVVVGGK